MYLPSFAPSRQRRVRPQRRVIALSAALIAVYGASSLWSLQRAHDQALRAAGAGLESMARSAETGTTRSLFEIDVMLIGIEQIVSVADDAARQPGAQNRARSIQRQESVGQRHLDPGC